MDEPIRLASLANNWLRFSPVSDSTHWHPPPPRGEELFAAALCDVGQWTPARGQFPSTPTRGMPFDKVTHKLALDTHIGFLMLHYPLKDTRFCLFDYKFISVSHSGRRERKSHKL